MELMDGSEDKRDDVSIGVAMAGITLALIACFLLLAGAVVGAFKLLCFLLTL